MTACHPIVCLSRPSGAASHNRQSLLSAVLDPEIPVGRAVVEPTGIYAARSSCQWQLDWFLYPNYLPAMKQLGTGVNYLGQAGVSAGSLRALEIVLHNYRPLQTAYLLTADGTHAFLLESETEGLFAIRSGFRSGYRGEGPRALAYALQLLYQFGVHVEDRHVAEEVISRLDDGQLTQGDIRKIKEIQRLPPNRSYEHVYEYIHRNEERPWEEMYSAIPFGLIDPRLRDLALTFDSDFDQAILTGFRRLEAIVRERLVEKSDRVFAAAFNGEASELSWLNVNASEHAGRANLFVGAYGAFRNPRAHSTAAGDHRSDCLAEFLLLNLLYRLEAAAVKRSDRPRLEERARRESEELVRQLHTLEKKI